MALPVNTSHCIPGIRPRHLNPTPPTELLVHGQRNTARADLAAEPRHHHHDASTTAAYNRTRTTTPLTDDARTAYNWQERPPGHLPYTLSLPAAVGLGTSAVFVNSATEAAAGTSATSRGDSKGFCQLWLALARQELQIPAAWAAQISDDWNQISTDLLAVTQLTPFASNHRTVVRCRRRYDPKDRIDLLPKAKRYYGKFIFHASKLLMLLKNLSLIHI